MNVQSSPIYKTYSNTLNDVEPRYAYAYPERIAGVIAKLIILLSQTRPIKAPLCQ
jgi:hypothetical protein